MTTPTAPSHSNCSNTIKNNNNRDPRFYFLDFLDRVRPRGSKTLMEKLAEEEEDIPTELNTINSSGGFLLVSPNKLTVKYTSVNLHGHDVGIIQANNPAPVKRLTYYFEMEVLNAGAKGQVSIGFTNLGYKMRRQPGWEANSCGYHGDDGLIYRGQAKGEHLRTTTTATTTNTTYTTGDTVGCGINYDLQIFFFTKNGLLVGTVTKDVKGPLYPTVAVHSQNEEVHVNFGKEKFKFDIKDYEAEQRKAQQKAIEQTSLHPKVSYGLVRSYFLHYGYEDTLNAFDLHNTSSTPPVFEAPHNEEQDISYELNRRNKLRQWIRGGDTAAAITNLQDWFPDIVQDDKSVTCLLLHCQRFIELVRAGELGGAVAYGRTELAKFLDTPDYKDFIQECGALLAYEDATESSVGFLLGDQQREVVADAVNAMVLSKNPNREGDNGYLCCYLEKLLRQLTACSLEKRLLTGGEGEAFQLNRVLKKPKSS